MNTLERSIKMIRRKKTLTYDTRLKERLYKIEDSGKEMSNLLKRAFLKILS